VPHLARMTVTDLLVAGATGGRVAVFALLVGYLQELLPEDVAVGAFERLAASGIAAILVTVLVFLLVAVLISLVATVVVYWELTLRREPEHIVITRGLLDRRRALIPSHRVQALRVHANPIRRVLRLASVSAVLAGYNVQKGEQQETSMLLPIARSTDAFGTALRLLDAPETLAALELEKLPARALAHRLIQVTVVALVLGGGASALLGPPGAVAFVVLPLGTVWSWMAWRVAGHVVVDDHVVVRSGGLSLRHYIVPVANVQHLELRSSPLQRALTLATLRLRIPKAAPAVTGLARPRADQRFETLARLLVG
jgi:putative membrane protein